MYQKFRNIIRPGSFSDLITKYSVDLEHLKVGDSFQFNISGNYVHLCTIEYVNHFTHIFSSFHSLLTLFLKKAGFLLLTIFWLTVVYYYFVHIPFVDVFFADFFSLGGGRGGV